MLPLLIVHNILLFVHLVYYLSDQLRCALLQKRDCFLWNLLFSWTNIVMCLAEKRCLDTYKLLLSYLKCFLLTLESTRPIFLSLDCTLKSSQEFWENVMAHVSCPEILTWLSRDSDLVGLRWSLGVGFFFLLICSFPQVFLISAGC